MIRLESLKDLYDFMENKKIVCSRKKLKKLSCENINLKKTQKSFNPFKADLVKNDFEKLQQLCIGFKKQNKNNTFNKYDELCEFVKNVNKEEKTKNSNNNSFHTHKKILSDEIIPVVKKKSSKNTRKQLFLDEMSGYNSDKSNNNLSPTLGSGVYSSDLINLINLNNIKKEDQLFFREDSDVVTTLIFESDSSKRTIFDNSRVTSNSEILSNSIITVSCSDYDK